MTMDLFSQLPNEPWVEELAPGALVLHHFVSEQAPSLLAEVTAITTVAPLRHLITPGGYRMSVAMSNCGSVGWVSDARGYRYSPIDPLTEMRWPAMPESFMALAISAARQAGFLHFQPNACLINRYEVGAKLSLHQDKDELDLRQPIVSVSLGLPAVFQFGGASREAKCQKVLLSEGDVVVWGGPSRLNYHGVLPVKAGFSPSAGAYRINLTFRCTGRSEKL
ncbi:DNA oxidative demethylase AlkB [Yersinia kristensenii]|uniref:Alpha-ketoglutarate-dependent dioxygenase AlkB n=1 Tax=Yersinia kristensenii TaxID=28152 RepID=A0AB73NH83_YERKR|nr:DNA oxidative demethylase AlkB [Yersinia kristensenii]EEP92133.1 Alpha-ketoglutarate-dependent dioxygenase alkB [Yersinia kristensenii ATCC 33638]MBW5811737.1 DNA oxidative demethylase AlkB [Yersinia kristensenii]MBW5817176.1 DNA oxidative demethylase AlkB [Yersinia kristensenii]MBW5825173.1 DNA oxidative demethylase AlkB [Yersinia kristensenii]MBW5828999.1 DNA oxidative demethylase AlkB [Yersinia kristensenii]